MKVNPGFWWSKIIKILNRPALRNCNIDKTAVIGAGSNCIDTNIGRYTYTGKNNSMVNVDIGAFCSIASYCAIGGGGHDLSAVSTSPIFFSGYNAFRKNLSNIKPAVVPKVVIGNDVWIGEAVFIFEGIHIGDGAVIGAHSVVTHDVAPYTIVAGAPAKELHKRFESGIIQELLTLKWWNWSEEKLKMYGKYFGNPNNLIEATRGEKI